MKYLISDSIERAPPSNTSKEYFNGESTSMEKVRKESTSTERCSEDLWSRTKIDSAFEHLHKKIKLSAHTQTGLPYI